jgi:hypothetical protein
MPPDDRGAMRHAGTAEDWWEGSTARVFVSCGQRTKAERELGDEVKRYLREEGYCPYVAVRAHSSRSLREEIFDRLQTAEYVLFLDFKRERLGRSAARRGSLFSHQELAVASFLDIDVLPFQQRGVKREGVLDYIQGNPVPFGTTAGLLQKIKSEIRDAGWRSDWRRDLRVELVSEGPDEAMWPDGRRARYFHVWVRNRHRRLVASECTVFLTRVVELATGKERVPDSVQLKPRRSVDLFVAIPPGHGAQFDVAFIFLDAPSKAFAGINPFKIDSTTAARQALLEGPGEFELVYEVYSREFPPISVTGRLVLGATIDEATFRIVEPTRRLGASDEGAAPATVGGTL